MDEPTTTRHVHRSECSTAKPHRSWVVTDAGRAALATDPAGDLTREPRNIPHRPARITPMTDPDLHAAFAHVDLFLDECLLTLHRTGYRVGEAAQEIVDRLDNAAARVRARAALAEDMRQAAAVERPAAG